MQQLIHQFLTTRWYFAFGDPQKTSLSIQFCRQNGFQYFNNPTVQQVSKSTTDTIIQGGVQLFEELQKIKPELHVIYFGNDYSNEKLKKIRKQYQQIGYCKDVLTLDHNSCRKSLYPNLIFIYGPLQQQNQAAASTLAYNLSYSYSQLPPDPNTLIKHTSKTHNYIINGLYPSINSITILQQYFTLRIIHFKHNRQDLPKHNKYFDQQHDLIKQLKNKKYYYQIKGNDDPVTIMDNVGVKLCPRLVYVNGGNGGEQGKYVGEYLEQGDGVNLNIFNIQAKRKKKGLPLACNLEEKVKLLNQILYKNLDLPEVVFTDFPWQTEHFIFIENMNRKFQWFIDLSPASKYTYSKQYSSPIYFLQTQRRIVPTLSQPLKQQITNSIQYWIVNGPGTCGKTTVAKYIAAQFGFKLIQFEAEVAAAKEKIASPQDGEEVPVKKYINYFANIVKSNPKNVYIFDSLPYTGADLQLWVQEVGSPNVINLKVEINQLIKRTRKKAQSDQNAQIAPQQTQKSTELTTKNLLWLQKLSQYSPQSKIYQLDSNTPQILLQPHINTILRPRIFLTQKNNSLIYQNIAIKYDMGLINLQQIPLRSCVEWVRRCGKRDVILANYGVSQEKCVSQDLYWIQKCLGDIRYVGVWQPQQIQIKQKIMKLQKPPQPIKPKPAQGQQQQEQPPAQQQGQKPKKQFNIYQHEWTQPIQHKNLSQWFFKLKKNITKKQSNQKKCYEGFGEVLEGLNRERNSCWYEVVK